MLDESEERLRYFGTPEATIANIYRHTKERSLDQHCHDVGTVIRLREMGLLKIDHRINLASKMDASLEALGVSTAIRSKTRGTLLG
jgi:hypothetical protein